ncbi:MAG: hypothetical protein UF067_07485, partial [Paludibacteraceae bacterium]|nr:hypothetical protein [Paludibacteraceae bacterium]
MTRKFISGIAAILFSVLAVSGQESVIDEIVWVVGDEAILRSDVEEQRMRFQYEGTKVEGDPYCFIPEQLALQKLFLDQAKIDSVYADEASVSSQVDMRINYLISQVGSKEKLEEYLQYVPIAKKALKKLLKLIRFYDLELYLAVGDVNAHKAGENFGKINALVYSVLGLLCTAFTVKIKHTQIDCVFDEKKLDAQLKTVIKAR